MLRLLLISFAVSAQGWWDQGHLVVAGVAKLLLSDSEISALERPLSLWEAEYPGLSSIVTAAVWPDHIKCEFSSPFCHGTPALDGLEVFNQWHYVSNIFNPQNISLSPLHSQLPLPGNGAVWALTELFQGVHRLDQGEWNFKTLSPARPDASSVIRPNRHSAGPLKEERLHDLSPFAWNLRLRLLIHIFGDLHQPLHSMETFSSQFPHGDLGGTQVGVDLDGTELSNLSVSTLHSLWDSCGGQDTTSWPSIGEEEILDEAAALLKTYPKEYFGERATVKDFFKVAEDSYKVGTTSVYGEIDWKVERPFGALPFRPSEDYLDQLRSVCKEQLTLGGYRLASVLKSIAVALSHAHWVNELMANETPLPATLLAFQKSGDNSYISKSSDTPLQTSMDSISTPIHTRLEDWLSNVTFISLTLLAAFSCWKWISIQKQFEALQRRYDLDPWRRQFDEQFLPTNQF